MQTMEEAGYHIYQPYYTEVDQSAEFLNEKILVNEKDLYTLVQTIRIKSECKPLALVGEIESILHNVGLVIGESVVIPIPEPREHNSSSIFAVVTDEYIIFMLPIEAKFLYNSAFDKENIIVTLFRFLQDFSPYILLCTDTTIKTNFCPGPKNPFSGGAHDHQIFKMEEQQHTEVKIEELATNFTVLQNELDSDFFKQLVLNENGSKFFLHLKCAGRDPQELARQKEVLPSLVQRLLHCALQHKQSEVKSHFDSLRLDSNDQLFPRVLTLHKTFVCSMQTIKNDFQSSLISNMKQVCSGMKSLKKGIMGYNRTHKYEFPPDYDPSGHFYSLADLSSVCAIDKKIDEFNIGKGAKKCSKLLFDQYIKNVADVFCHLLHFTTTDRKAEVFIDVRDEMKSCYGNYKAHLSLKRKLGDKLKGFRDDLYRCFDVYFRELEEIGELNLTPCVANVVQSNDGKYQNISYATYTFRQKVAPQALLQWFTQARDLYQRDPRELLQNVSVVSCYSVNSGRYFLVLLSMKCPRLQHALVTMSSCGMQGLINLTSDNFVMVVTEKKDIQQLYIMDNARKEIVVFQIKDMAMRDEHVLCSYDRVHSSVISATLFPKKQRLLMLTKQGEVFECNLRTKQITKMEIKENTDGVIITKHLAPSHGGGKYCQIYSLTNENFFMLRSNSVIDVFESNLKLVHTFPVHKDFCELKIFADNVNVYISIVGAKSISSYICMGLGSDVELQLKGAGKKEAVMGNPIIDIIYASQLKYGPNAHFIGGPEKSYFYFLRDMCDSEIDSKLQSYLRTFSAAMVVNPLSLETFLKVELTLHNSSTSHGCLDSILLSRVPLQIATIEGNNLVPLIDGIRQSISHLSSSSSLAESADFLSFGHIEKIVEELRESSKGIRVVSIVGKQSSGKSYLLNRLFGTRFSVAATRCTDGIWMSYARLASQDAKSAVQDFLVLDCEGLFSIRRNELEETKLLTVLAGISDVTILNQDLNFSRHITRLFTNLNSAVDRVKGTTYFKGFLMIAVRDVVSEENHQTAEELKRNMVELNRKGDHQFLTKLFNRILLLQCLNNYSMIDAFLREIGNVRSLLFDFRFSDLGIPTEHWVNGSDCIDNLKILLMQLYSDDNQSSDEHLKEVKLIYLEREVVAAWGQIQKVGERANKLQTYSISDGGNCTAELQFSQMDIIFDSSSGNDGYKIVVAELRSKFTTTETEKGNTDTYNISWLCFNQFLADIIADRIDCVRHYLNHLVGTFDKFFSDDERKKAIVRVEEKLNSLSSNFSLCLETCHECNLKCTDRKGHKDANLSTKTTIQKEIDEKRELVEKMSAGKAELENYESQRTKLGSSEVLDTKIQELEQQLESAEEYDCLSTESRELSNEISSKTALMAGKKKLLDKLPHDDNFEKCIHEYASIVEKAALDINVNFSAHCKILEASFTTSDRRIFLVESLKSLETLNENQLSDVKLLLETVENLLVSSPEQEVARMLETCPGADQYWKIVAIQNIFHVQESSVKQVLQSVKAMKTVIESKKHIFCQNIDDIRKDIQNRKEKFAAGQMNLQQLLEEQNEHESMASKLSTELSSQTEKILIMADNLKQTEEAIWNLSQEEESYHSSYGDLEQMKATQERRLSDYIKAHSQDFITGLIQYHHMVRNEATGEALSKHDNEFLDSWEQVGIKNSQDIDERHHFQATKDSKLGTYGTPSAPDSCSREKEDGLVTDSDVEATSMTITELTTILERRNEELLRMQTTLEKQQVRLVALKESGKDSDDEDVDESDIENLQLKVTKTQKSIKQAMCEIESIELKIKSKKCVSVNSSMFLSKVQQRFSFLLSNSDHELVASNIVAMDFELRKLRHVVEHYEESCAQVNDIESQLELHCHEKLVLQQSELSHKIQRYNATKVKKVEELRKKTGIKNKRIIELSQHMEKGVDSCGAPVTSDDIKKLQLKIDQIDSAIIVLQNDIMEIDTNIASDLMLHHNNEHRLGELAAHKSEFEKLHEQLSEKKAAVLVQEAEAQELKKKMRALTESRSALYNRLLKMVLDYYKSWLLEQLNRSSSDVDKQLQNMNNDIHARKMLLEKMECSRTNATEYKAEVEKLKLYRLSSENQCSVINDAIKAQCEKIKVMQTFLKSEENDFLQLTDQLKTHEHNMETISDIEHIFIAIEDAFKQMMNFVKYIDGLAKNQCSHFQCMKDFRDLETICSDLESKLKCINERKSDLEKIALEPVTDLRNQLQEKLDARDEYCRLLQDLEKFAQVNQEYLAKQAEMKSLEKSLRCFCQTNHKCDKFCGICPEKKPCKHPAGHAKTGDGKFNEKELHICSKEQHDCPGECEEVESCGNKCMYAVGHSNPVNHKCSSSHQCAETCKYCMNTCTRSLTEEHTVHICNEMRCPMKCILCGSSCCGTHNHDETTEMVPDIKNKGEMINLHICDKEHQCPNKCEAKGVCEVHYEEEIRKHENPECEQEYMYIKPKSSRKSCAILLEAGQTSHDEKHSCECDHKCDDKCRECGSFCKEMIDHVGKHTTITHRNKEFCYCVTKVSDASVTITAADSGKKERIYHAGDNFILETCVQQCKRKGRAHYHLVPCPGGDDCGQVLYKDDVKHCLATERFYPFIDTVFDKFLCERFWSHYNWTMPSDEEEIKLCNYICPSKLHNGSEKKPSFCSFPAWHCSSDLARDHRFDCHDMTKESVFAGMDICFCIDTTGSMGPFIEQCKSGIKKIMADTVEKLRELKSTTATFRFAVVGYKDHCDNPVVQKQDFTTDVATIAFLNTLRASGGGDTPEAVLDGLDTVVSLSWKETTTRLLFHILDSPPHGRQFWTGDDSYPTGCPCGRKEVDVLKKLKQKNVTYNIVPLTSQLSTMISVFEEHIPCISRPLSLDLSTLIATTVCDMIEDSELTAIRIDFTTTDSLDIK